MKQLAGQDYTEGFTTDLNQTQQKIIRHIQQLQPVCRKVICLNTASYSESTIQKNIRKLFDKEMLTENSNGGLELTQRAEGYLA